MSVQGKCRSENSKIRRVITIWDKLFSKLRVSFDGLVIKKKVFLYSSHNIDTHIYLVVEVIEVHRSVAFDLCLDKEFI